MGEAKNSFICLIKCMKSSFEADRISDIEMARGQQKIQSQQKNAERQKKLAKAAGPDQKTAAQAKLTYKCSVCMTQMPDPKTYKQHFESKHPKAAIPEEIKNI